MGFVVVGFDAVSAPAPEEELWDAELVDVDPLVALFALADVELLESPSTRSLVSSRAGLAKPIADMMLSSRYNNHTHPIPNTIDNNQGSQLPDG